MLIASLAIELGVGIIRSQTLADSKMVHNNRLRTRDSLHQLHYLRHVLFLHIGAFEPLILAESRRGLDVGEALDIKPFWSLHNFRCSIWVVEINVYVLGMVMGRAREQSTVLRSDRRIGEVVADGASYESWHLVDGRKGYN